MSPFLVTRLSASIPVFDWDGPTFLIFYAIILILGIVSSRSLRSSRIQRFQVPGEPRLDDPFEIAFLAGGTARVAQLAAVRLIASGHVEWRNKWFSAKLIPTFAQAEPAAHPLEIALLNAIRERGNKGLPPNEATAKITSEMRATEVRLAALGLRPTTEERSATILAGIWPMLCVLAVGGIKLVVGLSRDKPVWFLVCALILTVVITIYLGQGGPRLTSAGDDLLGKLRLANRDLQRMAIDSPHHHLEDISLGVALFGPACLASVAGFELIHQSLAQQVAPGSTTSSSSGCGTSGCSSGCSSGCGGGCGGCGGD